VNKLSHSSLVAMASVDCGDHVDGVAQSLGCWSLVSRLSLTCTWSLTPPPKWPILCWVGR